VLGRPWQVSEIQACELELLFSLCYDFAACGIMCRRLLMGLQKADESRACDHSVA